VSPEVTRGLAASLAPVLTRACGGRLGEIGWFKADWQRGGAATGVASWSQDDDKEVSVVVKLPVVQREYLWLRRLQPLAGSPEVGGENSEAVVPRLYASGEALGGYDLAWIVMERFPYGPLGLQWDEHHVPRMAEAIARFHQWTARFSVTQSGRTEDWRLLVEGSIESVKVNAVADKARWTTALKGLLGRLSQVVDEWNSRPINQWLHGDCHFANAMCRTSNGSGPVALIDLAEVHAGHWIEDAVYFERQLWLRPERMKEHKPVKAVAAARKSLGLEVEREYPRLAMIRRALLAGTAPKFLRSEGHPQHLATCLDWLERALKELK
jgi:hypothetical protein